MKKKETTLFKISKANKLLQFEVIAQEVDDGAVLITRKGQVDGATQEDVEPMYPKNVGRANETTPWGQAKLMHDSKIQKLKDKGYKIIEITDSTNILELRRFLENLEGTDANGNYLPMLAQKNIKRVKEGKGAGYVQRKLDGVRCLANTSTLRSRRGKYFEHLDHILNDIKGLPAGWELDGELYCHGKSLQQIVSMVKRDQPGNKKIKLRVYDILGTGQPYKIRKRILGRILKQCGKSLKRVKTYSCQDADRMWELFHKFREQGYEGAMWRDAQSLYEYNTRSWGLIKIKNFDEGEFEIVGANEATGRDIGTAVFILKTKEGLEFDCRPMGTREKRRDYLQNIELLIGDMATVRHQGWTDDGKPFHARVAVIRDYE